MDRQGTSSLSRRGPFLFAAVWIAATLFVMALPLMGLSSPNTRLVILIALLSLNVSSVNLGMGYAGEMNLGQVAFYAGGAYLAGYLAIHVINDLAALVAAAAVLGLVLGLISALPALRLRGWTLAMSSFFFVLLVPDVVRSFGHALGGAEGMTGIPAPSLFGMRLSNYGLYLCVVLVTSFWFVLYRNLVRSHYGAALLILKQSSVLARSLGLSPNLIKFRVYAIAGIPPALAGAMYAMLDGYVGPDTFHLDQAISFLAASILGGMSSIYGVFVGAALMQIGPLRSTAFQHYALVAYGAFLILGGVLLSGGIAGILKEQFRKRLGETHWLRRVIDGPSSYVPAGVNDVDDTPLKGGVLTIENACKNFGGNHALQDVSIIARPGRITAVIGPNGSGKTTLLNLVSGFYQTTSGKLSLDGHDITNLNPSAVARRGVARTFQTPQIPELLSTAEVVATGAHAHGRPSILELMLRLPRYWRVLRSDRVEASKVLRQLGLVSVADRTAASLPLGTRRLVELGRAMAAQPQLILLDEVASGLDESELQALIVIVRGLRDRGATVVLVEHNFALIGALADDVYVLARGRLVAHGTVAEVEANPAVRAEYFGNSDEVSFAGGLKREEAGAQ